MNTEVSILWIFVNAAFAVLALGVGFVAGAFFCGAKSSGKPTEDENEQENALEKRIAIERALLATGQLQDLAVGVACDVGEHSNRVEQISGDLNLARNAKGEVAQELLSKAVSEIVSANEELQKKLEKAERQIKAQAVEIAAHESEARTDSLTGLANRRAFDDELGRRHAEWERNSTPFSLVILDVDHFKKFNDTHGHQAGDEVLREVAKAMVESARTMDICCRYGGEEFAIILPATEQENATVFAERVRLAIAARAVEHEGKALQVTASVGLAQAQSGDDPKRILRRADEALYAAKEAGRNCGFKNTEGENLAIGELKKSGSQRPARVETKLLDKLANRTIFVNQLTQRVAESHRTSAPLSVMLVRIDAYEQVRASFGEAASLLMLDSVAQFLAGTLREMDLLARVSENRFAVLLPNADQAAAGIVATRANTALGSCKLPLGSEVVTVDARVAMTSIEELDSAAAMLERAESGIQKSETGDKAIIV